MMDDDCGPAEWNTDEWNQDTILRDSITKCSIEIAVPVSSTWQQLLWWFPGT